MAKYDKIVIFRKLLGKQTLVRRPINGLAAQHVSNAEMNKFTQSAETWNRDRIIQKKKICGGLSKGVKPYDITWATCKGF